MSNWYDAWADRYAEWFPGVADVPFYVALAREAEGPMVELAVGNGRVAIPVAQATNRRVVGIDSSPAMLAQARERAVEAGVERSTTTATKRLRAPALSAALGRTLDADVPDVSNPGRRDRLDLFELRVSHVFEQ